jgi:hypothetical protein
MRPEYWQCKKIPFFIRGKRKQSAKTGPGCLPYGRNKAPKQTQKQETPAIIPGFSFVAMEGRRRLQR